jgi:hypothetical protein
MESGRDGRVEVESTLSCNSKVDGPGPEVVIISEEHQVGGSDELREVDAALKDETIRIKASIGLSKIRTADEGTSGTHFVLEIHGVDEADHSFLETRLEQLVDEGAKGSTFLWILCALLALVDLLEDGVDQEEFD